MSGSRRIPISWADLPIELLEKISKCLHTEIESRLFRSVCKSWRSSTAPFKFPPSTLKLPLPPFAGVNRPVGKYLRLTDRTVYCIQPPECRDPNFWLVKIENSKDGKLRVLSPFSGCEIRLLPETQMPKVLNTLDFRVSEVCKSYTLDCVNPSKPKKKYWDKFSWKVAVSVGPNNDEYVIAAIDSTYHLWYIKSGDRKWTKVRDDYLTGKILDIVNYKGQFYGVDTRGWVWLFDSMFEGKIITYSGHSASKRHLMEFFDGDLVLVDEVTDENKRSCNCHDIDDGCHCYFPKTPVRNTVEQIRIYRMDKRGAPSVKAKLEFDGFIFLGFDCSFSVSAEEFKGIRVFYVDPQISLPTEEETKLRFPTEQKKKPHFHYVNGDNYFECDCWYSSEEDTGVVDNFVQSDDVKLMFRGLADGHAIGLFDFETGKVGSVLKFPEYVRIFWPPPSWLNRS